MGSVFWPSNREGQATSEMAEQFIEKLEKLDEAFIIEQEKVVDLTNNTVSEEYLTMLKDLDKNFLQGIRRSDYRFRSQIFAKLTCPIIPFSQALRDSLIDDRDEKRVRKIKNFLAEKATLFL